LPGKSSITTVLSLRLGNDFYKEIKALALREHRKISDFAEILICEALEARQKRAKRDGRK